MASYSLSPSLVFKGFYDDNSPLVDGKVFTWLAGTTTPVDTYQSNGGAANTNPVILNARGEANIWLDPAISYKIEVQDKDGNIVIPAKDNITVGENGLNASTVDDVGELRAYAGTANLLFCRGYDNSNDGCEGWFYFNSDINNSDDGVIYFSPNSAPDFGRWVRVFDGGPISCRYAGDNGALATSDTQLERLIGYVNSYGGSIYYPAGNYLFDVAHESISVADFMCELNTKFYIKETIKINGVLTHPRRQFLAGGSGYTGNFDLSDSATVAAFEWFGATGDGATDDLTPIQKAFDSGCKYFDSQSPQGYLISSPVNLPFFYSVTTQAGVYQAGPVYQIYPGVRESATVQAGQIYSAAPSSGAIVSLSGIYGVPIYAVNTTNGDDPYLFPGKTLDLSDLQNEGDSFYFEGYGDFSNGTTIDVYVYIGGASALGFSGITAIQSWSIRGRVIKLASGYSIMADLITDGATSSVNVSQAVSSPAVLQIAVGSAGAGDMSQKVFLVKIEPQKA